MYRIHKFDTYVMHKVPSLDTKTDESRFIYHYSTFHTTTHRAVQDHTYMIYNIYNRPKLIN